MIKTCVICGSEFDAKGSHVTCSEECRKENRRRTDREAQKRYRPKALPPKKCEYCGKEYIPVKKNQRFCGKSCSAIATPRKAPTFKERKYKCEICGAEFEARVSNAKYCSDECRKKAFRASSLNSYYRNKEKKPESLVKNKPKISLAEACRQMKELGIQYAEWRRLYGGG